MPETPQQPLEYGHAEPLRFPVRFVLLILAGFVGAALLWCNVPDIYQCFHARNWPSTNGVVVGKSTNSVSGGNLIPSGLTEIFSKAHAGIQYNYTVNSVPYNGSVISCDEGRQVEVALQYPLRGTVNVYYDPGNPSNAVIDRTVGSGTIGAVLVGAILLVFSVVSLIRKR